MKKMVRTCLTGAIYLIRRMMKYITASGWPASIRFVSHCRCLGWAGIQVQGAFCKICFWFGYEL